MKHGCYCYYVSVLLYEGFLLTMLQKEFTWKLRSPQNDRQPTSYGWFIFGRIRVNQQKYVKPFQHTYSFSSSFLHFYTQTGALFRNRVHMS